MHKLYDMEVKDLENIFDFLEAKCKAAGTNLTQVCRQANVERSGLERWKKENPKTLNTVAELIKVIDEIKAGKKAA